MSPGFAVGALKHLLVGKPIPSHLAHHERYTKSTGLAILSSDALSSVAYATEEDPPHAADRGDGGAVAGHADRLPSSPG